MRMDIHHTWDTQEISLIEKYPYCVKNGKRIGAGKKPKFLEQTVTSKKSLKVIDKRKSLTRETVDGNDAAGSDPAAWR